MKKTLEVLNVPAIQKEIREKHQIFIEKYSGTLEKVMADHRLFADIILAKLHRILVIFKEEKVIDDIKMIDQGPYKKIILCKNGYDTYVEMETNGKVIKLQGFTYTTGFDSDFRHQDQIFSNANDEEFNWSNFCLELLEYIHGTIYERKEVAEQMLKGMFEKTVSKEEIIKKISKKK